MDSIKKLYVVSIIIFICLSFYLIPSEGDKEIARAIKNKNEHPHSVMFDGINEPDIAEDDGTILGVDSNKNGIRDEVEIWINRNWKTYNERMAVRQYASDLQYSLVAAEKNERDYISHAASVEFTTLSCLIFIFGSNEAYKLDNRVRSVVYNNKKRENILENFNNYTYSYGSVVKDMKVGENYKGCQFKIENKEELLKSYKDKINKD